MNMMLDHKDLGTARGIVRRNFESAKTVSSRKHEVARIKAAMGSRSSLHNPKGRSRVLSRLSREFGDTGIASMAANGSPSGIALSYWTADQEDFEICIALIAAERGGSSVRTYTVGRLTKHAAVRFVQRTDQQGFETMILAAANAATLVTNVRNMAVNDAISEDAVVLVPAGFGLAAIVNLRSSSIITFIRMDRLGPLRQEVIEGVEPPSFGLPIMTLFPFHDTLLTPLQSQKIIRSAGTLRHTREFAARCDGELAPPT